MKQWILKWTKQAAGQLFFHMAPLAIVFIFAFICAQYLPAHYTIPLSFLLWFVVGYVFIKYSRWF